MFESIGFYKLLCLGESRGEGRNEKV